MIKFMSASTRKRTSKRYWCRCGCIVGVEVLIRVLPRIFLPSLAEQCKKAPPKAISRNYVIFPLIPI
jgi:hypothetical protein